MNILHAWADHGTECEALSLYGHVTRASIDPRPGAEDQLVQADGKTLPFADNTFDLAFVHPLCTKWASTTSISGDADDHEDYIPEARSEAARVADDYVVENRPEAPLDDPVVLEGGMFGLPIRYERAFETSFPCDQPPRQQTLGRETAETSPFFYSERSHAWWRSVKGLRQEHYPKEHVAKNAIPLPYIHHVCRAWLASAGEAQGVADYSDYDARMDERRAREANSSLGDYVTDGGRHLSSSGGGE
jgi:hypothetical protein